MGFPLKPPVGGTTLVGQARSFAPYGAAQASPEGGGGPAERRAAAWGVVEEGGGCGEWRIGVVVLGRADFWERRLGKPCWLRVLAPSPGPGTRRSAGRSVGPPDRVFGLVVGGVGAGWCAMGFNMFLADDLVTACTQRFKRSKIDGPTYRRALPAPSKRNIGRKSALSPPHVVCLFEWVIWEVWVVLQSSERCCCPSCAGLSPCARPPEAWGCWLPSMWVHGRNLAVVGLSRMRLRGSLPSRERFWAR